MWTTEALPVTPFTRLDLELHGLTSWDLESALAAGAVRRVIRGVYVRADVPDGVEVRCRAVQRVISDQSVVRDRTAAWLHGVSVFDHHELEILPPIETSVPRFSEPTRRADHAGCTRDLAPRDLMVLQGLCVTTPLRTALDLGCSMRPRSALGAMDQLARKHGLANETMARESLRYRRRRGVVQLRRLIPMVDARAESHGESWVRYEIITAGLPWPEPQHWIEIDGVPTYRLDMAYPLHRVVVEYDGEEHHTSAADRGHDERRREWLESNGWIVVVVTKDRLDRRSCETWTREVREALRSRTFSR